MAIKNVFLLQKRVEMLRAENEALIAALCDTSIFRLFKVRRKLRKHIKVLRAAEKASA